MGKHNERPINVGDRFEDSDPRQGNRVVRVVAVKSTLLGERVEYRIEVAALNPLSVGKSRSISSRSLRKRYQRVSR